MSYSWDEFLADTWCEINGGGTVTYEQERFMASLHNNKKLKAMFYPPIREEER